MASKTTRPELPDFTVGWVCALPIELAAARTVLDEEYEVFSQPANDTFIPMAASASIMSSWHVCQEVR
jgi:hypothetical protein